MPAGPWEAVRIGLPWHPAGAREDSPPTIAWSPEITRQEIRRGLPPISAIPIAHDPQRPTTFYTLEQADGEQLVSKLRSQFVVVNHEKAEARFAFDARTSRLIVIATEKQQAKILRRNRRFGRTAGVRNQVRDRTNIFDSRSEAKVGPRFVMGACRAAVLLQLFFHPCLSNSRSFNMSP